MLRSLRRYNLTGNLSGNCSECGRPVDQAAL